MITLNFSNFKYDVKLIVHKKAKAQCLSLYDSIQLNISR